jgi:hypothetical protein
MAHDESTDAGSGVVLVSGIVCAALAAGLIYFFHGQTPPIQEVDETWFRAPELKLDEAELRASRDAHYGAGELEDKPAYAEYRTNYQAANLLQFTDPTEAEISRMQKLLALTATDALTTIQKHDRFTAIGEPIFADCRTALDDLLDDIVERRVTMDAALSGDLGEDYDRYKRNCGHVMPVLRKHELVTADGEWRRPAYGPVLFDVLQRWRFASQVSNHVHPADGVSPADYRAMTEWRLMVPEAFSPSDRYQKLASARSKPPVGLNLDRAEAYIAAAAGDWNRARKAYAKVCKRPEATAQDHVACDWLKRFGPDGGVGDDSESTTNDRAANKGDKER